MYKEIESKFEFQEIAITTILKKRIVIHQFKQ